MKCLICESEIFKNIERIYDLNGISFVYIEEYNYSINEILANIQFDAIFSKIGQNLNSNNLSNQKN